MFIQEALTAAPFIGSGRHLDMKRETKDMLWAFSREAKLFSVVDPQLASERPQLDVAVKHDVLHADNNSMLAWSKKKINREKHSDQPFNFLWLFST